MNIFFNHSNNLFFSQNKNINCIFIKYSYFWIISVDMLLNYTHYV